jgi:predicted transcriptional regulator YheO
MIEERYKHLQNYFSIADAIVGLFRPHVEVVIHDIASGTVAYIDNPITKRRVGDPSGDQPFEDKLGQTVIGPYRKVNTDGRNCRSITAVLEDSHGQSIGYFCVNFDVSLLENLSSQIAAFAFLPGSLEPHAPFFHDNWRQALERAVEECEAAAGISISAITTRQRIDLIARLESDGVLNVRNAPTVVANRIGFSRAALYKHLKRIRSNNKKSTECSDLTILDSNNVHERSE